MLRWERVVRRVDLMSQVSSYVVVSKTVTSRKAAQSALPERAGAPTASCQISVCLSFIEAHVLTANTVIGSTYWIPVYCICDLQESVNNERDCDTHDDLRRY